LEDADHPEVFILFGNLALQEGRLTDSTIHVEKATALAASRRWTPKQRDRFERLCQPGLAAIAVGRGDWKAARTALEGWLEREPANARVRQRLAKALFWLGQRKAAHQELLRAARDDSGLELAAITMGWLYTQADDVKKAQEWMDYAVQSAANSLGVHIGLAAWLLEQNRPDEAEPHAAAAARLDASSLAARGFLGVTSRARKHFAASEQLFESLARQSPRDIWIRSQLAIVLAAQENEAKRRRALELAEAAVRETPDAPELLATLGTVYDHLSRFGEAERHLQCVVQSGEGSLDSVYILARVLAECGLPDDARELLKASLAARGLFLARKDAQEWLTRLTGNAKARS
jgi:predicted Zn-dependent protease